MPPSPSCTPLDLNRRKAVLVDMDGVLVFGGTAAPGACDLLRIAGDRLYLVTNESAYGPEELAERLGRRRLRIPPGRLVMAGPMAVERLKREHPKARILVRGAAGLHDLADRAGLYLCRPEEPADIVLLGRDPRFDMPGLERVVRAVEDGAALWATNTDLRHPIEQGRYTYQTGALLQAVLACVGDVPVEVIGKPRPLLFTEALRRAGVRPGEAIMIGDSPETDAAGARAAGIPFILVGGAPGASAPTLAGLLAAGA